MIHIICIILHISIYILICILLSYSCNDFGDDPFVPCFGCDNATPRNSFDGRHGFKNANHKSDFLFMERQSGESFRATQQRRRLICPRGSRTNGVGCRIRASRAIEIRQLPYRRIQKFIHAEEYLSDDDLEILRFFQTLFL